MIFEDKKTKNWYLFFFFFLVSRFSCWWESGKWGMGSGCRTKPHETNAHQKNAHWMYALYKNAIHGQMLTIEVLIQCVLVVVCRNFSSLPDFYG